MTSTTSPTPEVAQPPGPPGDSGAPVATRPWFKKKRFWALGVLAIVIIASVASGGGDESTTSSDAPDVATDDTDTPTGGQTPGGQDVYTVGQTATSGDLAITLHAASDPWESTNEFESAEEGSRFVAVEVSIENSGTDMMTFSPLLSMEIIDSQSRAWDATFAGADIPSISGDIPSGETRRGWAVFEVSNDAAGLQLRVEGNFTATGSLFALS